MPNLGIYIPDNLHSRLQRLREKGIDLNASSVAQRALESAIEIEENAMAGNRTVRLLARLRTAKTAREQAEAEGEAAGRQWAEDVAALSELKSVQSWLDKMNAEDLDVGHVYEGDRVMLEFVQWLEDEILQTGERYTLPESVPVDAFRSKSHVTARAAAFMRGAVDVLRIAERAMAQEEAAKSIQRFRKTLGAISQKPPSKPESKK